MTAFDLWQIVIYFVLLIACVPFLGAYMARVFSGERTLLTPVLQPVERAVYHLTGVHAEQEQDWRAYALALLVFNLLGLIVVFGLQTAQSALPLNPMKLPPVEPLLAFNTATSFMTNTNWQAYGGETTMSYLTQMLGLSVQNFLSAATGIAVVIALTRGLARRTARTIGNFWVDVVRCVLYILLPLCLVLAIFCLARVSCRISMTIPRQQLLRVSRSFCRRDRRPRRLPSSS